MKRISLLLIAAAFFLPACAQTKKPVSYEGAFFRIQFPGNLPVDENGNPLRGADTVRMMYLYTQDPVRDAPKIQYVQYGNRLYSATVFPAEFEQEKVIGTAKKTNAPVVLKPVKGRRYWQLELLPLNKFAKGKDGVIVITGSFRGKKFTLTSNKEIELQPELRQ